LSANPDKAPIGPPRSAGDAALPGAAPADMVADACARARQAFALWRKVAPQDRANALHAVATALKAKKELFSQREAADTGKPLRAALGEVEGAIGLWEYAAALARNNHSHAFASSLQQGMALTLREPMGTVGMIVPWNYPLITASERLPFALAAGCSVVLKPSELAMGSLPLLIEEMAATGLFPAHTVQILYGDAQVGKALCANPDVDMIAFVGSTKIGRQIESAAALCGKRVSAELGGNNFVLVFADADLPKAAQAVIDGGFRNGGQACIAGTHVLVDPRIARAFAEQLQSALLQRFPRGHGNSNDNDNSERAIQPMISAAHCSRIAQFIEAGIAEGLAMLDGSDPTVHGQQIGPVIFDQVPLTSALFREELFGPIVTLSVIDEARFFDSVRTCEHGLAAYVWTGSMSTAFEAARELRAGRIWINADPDAWLPELPAGGFGASGTGRELGPEALHTYSLPKSVLLS
jgi:betaine-aldehyde dehydrogenase